MSDRDDDNQERRRRDDSSRGPGNGGDRAGRSGSGDRRPSGGRPPRDGEQRPWSPRPPQGDRRQGDRPSGDRQGGYRSGGYSGGSGRPEGGRPSGDRFDSRRPPRGDGPAGAERGQRPFSSRPNGDRPRGDRPAGARPYGDRPRGDRPQGDRPYGDRPRGDRPQGDRPYGDRPRGDRPQGDRPYGDRPRGDRPQGDRPNGDRARNDRPYGDRPRNDRPQGDRPRGDRPQGDRPYGDRPRGDRPQGGRPGQGGRPDRGGAGSGRPWTGGADRGSRAGRDARDGGGQWEDRDPLGLRSVRPRQFEPHLPDEVEPRQLDKVARAELKTLSKENADFVARHLVMAASLIDDDPTLAHQHAQAAGRRAGRIAVVRETIAITAYALEDYALALRELRTYRRISGRNDQLPLMVDSERGLERPDRALELGQSVDAATLEVPVRVSLAIALSGARLDLGQTDAALRELEIPQLDRTRAFSYSPELFEAYATVLEELGRADEAATWTALARRARGALNTLDIEEDSETVEIVEEEIEGFDGDDVALDDELASDAPSAGDWVDEPDTLEALREPDDEPDDEPGDQPGDSAEH